MTATDKLGEAPVRKTTRIATNAPEISDAMSARCEGGHRHVHLVSGRPKHAAVFPPGFCSAVIKGFEMYQKRREAGVRWTGDTESFDEQMGHVGALLNTRADLCDPEEEIGGRYVDDLKGTELDPVLTTAARREELEEFRRRKVYRVVPRSAMRPGAKIVGVRWVETDKGAPGSPKVRSQLVAQEFANDTDPDGELFAPTPHWLRHVG